MYLFFLDNHFYFFLVNIIKYFNRKLVNIVLIVSVKEFETI